MRHLSLLGCLTVGKINHTFVFGWRRIHGIYNYTGTAIHKRSLEWKYNCVKQRHFFVNPAFGGVVQKSDNDATCYLLKQQINNRLNLRTSPDDLINLYFYKIQV